MIIKKFFWGKEEAEMFCNGIWQNLFYQLIDNYKANSVCLSWLKAYVNNSCLFSKHNLYCTHTHTDQDRTNDHTINITVSVRSLLDINLHVSPVPVKDLHKIQLGDRRSSQKDFWLYQSIPFKFLVGFLTITNKLKSLKVANNA